MIDVNSIFETKSDDDFNRLALDTFRYQFENNNVYRSYSDLLNIHPSEVNTIDQIPFLPIDFFKTRQVLSSSKPVVKVFESSGTTGSLTSKHFVTDLELYKTSFRKGFTHFYGNIEDYVILALLPSYLERDNSSLVYMVNDLIKASKHPESGFYLGNHKDLLDTLTQLELAKKKTLLIGVSFALLDFVEQNTFNLKHTIVMETGGMKGRRKELIREDLHKQLKRGFDVEHIHSEYGMTELLSQAYSKGNCIFKTPPWMKVLIRDTEDPFTTLSVGKTGGINIMDLANINSCSFIETQDLGKLNEDGSFEILGRFDHSNVRGCNLMTL